MAAHVLSGVLGWFIGLSPQQQPGSYQGGEKMSTWRKPPTYGKPGQTGANRPLVELKSMGYTWRHSDYTLKNHECRLNGN